MNWHDYFTYDPRAGELIWKTRSAGNARWNTRWVGKVAGSVSRCNGQIKSRRVCVDYRWTGVHRIIWEMHYGQIPEGAEIDHKDVNPLNNRLDNLRLATRSQNQRNTRRQKRNISGFKGVSWDSVRGKWCAGIAADKKSRNLGRFDTKGEAAVAYAKAAIRYHGAFARTQ